MTTDEKLDTLIIEFREHRAEQRQMCSDRGDKIEGHHYTLYGNGNPGLKMLVDRLATRMSIATWVASVAGAAVIAGGVKLIFFPG